MNKLKSTLSTSQGNLAKGQEIVKILVKKKKDLKTKHEATMSKA